MVHFGKALVLVFAAVACVAIHASPVDVEQSGDREESSSSVFVFPNCTGKPPGASFRLIEPLTQDVNSDLFGQFAVNPDGARW